jgi:arginase
MGLAVATGLCWTRLAGSIPGFQRIAGSNIMLVGGRDFDEGEQERLERAGVTVINLATIQNVGMQDALQPGISKLVGDVDEIHVHIDPDALDSKEAPANSYQFLAEGGMSVGQLRESIASVKKNSRITSATIASFEPAYDPQGKTLSAMFELITQILRNE